MVIIRTKKNKKQRGGMTYGWGSKKKHRGAGSRGGRGRAGAGKHGIHNKEKLPVVKTKGFVPNNPSRVPPETLSFKNIQSLIDNKKLEKQDDLYLVDGFKLGFDKLLGSGFLNHKLKIVNLPATPRAKEKITKLGGVVE